MSNQKTYLYVAFDEKKEPLLYDTNQDILDRSRLEKADIVLKFEVISNPVSEKFLKLINDYYQYNKDSKVPDRFGYTYYMSRGFDNIISAKKELNEIVDAINKHGSLSISKELMLNEESHVPEIERLNQLHSIFELESPKTEYREDNRLQNLLWRLNNTVHTIEGVRFDDVNKINPKWFFTYFYHYPHVVQMTADDYRYFELENPYTLYLDLDTAGKTLLECFWNNDMEVIKRGTVRQQSTINSGLYLSMVDYVSDFPVNEEHSGDDFNFNKKNTNELVLKLYDKWLNDNEVGKYINLSDPQFTPGRHPLARLVDPDPGSLDWPKIWNKNYALAGIFF